MTTQDDLFGIAGESLELSFTLFWRRIGHQLNFIKLVLPQDPTCVTSC